MDKRQPRLLPIVAPEQEQVGEAPSKLNVLFVVVVGFWLIFSLVCFALQYHAETEQRSITEEIVEGIAPLVKFTGRHCIDRKPEEVTAFIENWLTSPTATKLVALTTSALKSKDAHQSLCEVVYGIAAATKKLHPQRVCTAVCCDILEKVSSKLAHIKHVRTLKTELFRSIYKDYDETRCKTMRDFLLLTPFYEEARSLSVKVNKLMKERKILEEAENNAEQRQATRKNVISRTTRRCINTHNRHMQHT